MTNPYPAGSSYKDPCGPVAPVDVKPAVPDSFIPDAVQVDDKTPYQVAGNPNRVSIVITNQGDGAGAGSVVYVTSTPYKGAAKSRGIRIPVGAGRAFTHTAEMWVISETTGMAAGGNLVDFQTEGFFG